MNQSMEWGVEWTERERARKRASAYHVNDDADKQPSFTAPISDTDTPEGAETAATSDTDSIT